jgi:putative oxidoreductase
MNKFARFNLPPLSIDLGLLVFRIAWGLDLLAKHGLFKIPLLFGSGNPQFPDPFHLGVRATLAFAFLSDGICSVLAVFGLATRFAAVIMIVNLTVAWGMVYGFSVTPPTGELLALYLGGAITLLLTGPGRFSLDAKLARKR